MNQEKAEEIIRGFITNDAVVSYYCAREGATLAIFRGEMAIGQSVTAEIKKNIPLAAVKCPGVENFDLEAMTDEVEIDHDTGIYQSDNDHVMELDDVIWEYMDRNELEEKREQLIEELLDDWEDRQ